MNRRGIGETVDSLRRAGTSVLARAGTSVLDATIGWRFAGEMLQDRHGFDAVSARSS